MRGVRSGTALCGCYPLHLCWDWDWGWARGGVGGGLEVTQHRLLLSCALSVGRAQRGVLQRSGSTNERLLWVGALWCLGGGHRCTCLGGCRVLWSVGELVVVCSVNGEQLRHSCCVCTSSGDVRSHMG